ncbi:MAG TPA: hypothetical protein VMV90_12210 [Rectinemataceae bacterium]|nr:hypothetical protein [Rectinemataceae bacterium]
MVFKGTKGPGLARGLAEAAVWGYPGPEGIFALSGEGDLRQAVYSPESSFTETAAILLSTLFTEDIDPLLAVRLAERAFPETPAIVGREKAIPVVDLAGGPTGSSADYGAALLSSLLSARSEKGERRLIAAFPGPWGTALVEAASHIESLEVLLICGKEEVRGIKTQRLAREGGKTLLVGLRADRKGRADFLRALCGRRLAGRDVVVAGPGNPVEFAAQLILHAAIFAELRRGAAGEIFVALPAESSLGLAAGLWAWRLGLPLSGLLLPHADRPLAEAEPEFGELVDRFGSERSGLLGSILSGQDVSEAEALAARNEFAAGGGPWLDRPSSLALAAAKRHLVPELLGHTHIVVARHGHPYWDRPSVSTDTVWDIPVGGSAERPDGLAGALADARMDATIDADPARLEALLESFD